MIRGLGPNKAPHLYLDDFIPEVDWESLHTEVCRGIALSKWQKTFVSSGVHKDWADKEITPYLKTASQHLNAEQLHILESLPLIEQKLKYLNALSHVPHPFWVLWLRENMMIEQSRVANKSVESECEWTDNAKHFPKLRKFIESMPFQGIGRIILFMTEANNQTVPHFDAGSEQQRNTKPNDDFVWFTTKPTTKSVFVMDDETKERVYPEDDKRFVWFNEMDFHGTEPVEHFAFSIRVDGVFRPGLKEMLYAS